MRIPMSEVPKCRRKINSFALFALLSLIITTTQGKSEERPRLTCSWQPFNSSLNCAIFGAADGQAEKPPTKVDFSKISSKHQREDTQILSLNCQQSYIQFFPDDFLEHMKRASRNAGSNYFYYYDGGRFEVNPKTTGGKSWKKVFSNLNWPLLETVKVSKCPLISRRSRFNGSLFLGLYLSLFGGIPVTKSNQKLASKLNLKVLDLSDNDLKRSLFTSSSARGKNRKFLSIECEEFGVKLQHVNLSFNTYESLKDVGFDNCDNQRESGKKFFTNLFSLNLNFNKINGEVRGKDLDFAPNLRELYLAGNEIDYIDKDFFESHTDLRVVDFSSNKLSSLHPDLLKNQTHLRQLKLQNNTFTSLPSGFQGLSNLMLLNLSSNSISGQIPKETSRRRLESPFSSLTSLVALDLSDNKISGISWQLFEGLENLEVLTLAGNQIRTLGAGVFRLLKNLRALVLTNNKLKTLNPGAFIQLKNLQSLSLNENGIKKLPRSVENDSLAA